MRALYTQFSGLAGLLTFLNQLWNYAPLERTILMGFGAGLFVYLMLILGDATISRILEHTPPRLAEETAGDAPDAAAGAPKTDAKESAKPQPAAA